MFGILTWAAVLCLTLFAVLYARLGYAISQTGGVPRVGKPGVLGFVSTALRYTKDAYSVILEGREKFSGRPFIIPTLSGPFFLLGPEHLERIRSSPDTEFNQPDEINHVLQLPYTMDVHQMRTPYQATVLRTDVNRALPNYIPEIFEECELAMDDMLRTKGNGKIEFPVFDTMTHLIARITNRVILGVDICRNDDFINAAVRFAETVTVIGLLVSWSPVVLRPLVYYVLSFFLGGKKEGLKYLVPFLSAYLEKRELTEASNRSCLIIEHMLNSSLPEETVERIGIRLLHLNFASVHTSSIFITQTLFEIALLSGEEVDSIRKEISDALESEGGWTKGALHKFRKLDSALREVGRVHGLMYFAVSRVAVNGYDLGDGTAVPPKSRMGVDMTAIHFDPEIYPDPNRCDLFRFSKLREEPGKDTKYGFSSVNNQYLPFGAGRHACAGRFFAAMQLKVMLAQILLKFDISYPSGITSRPKNITINGGVIPNPKASIILTPRQVS